MFENRNQNHNYGDGVFVHQQRDAKQLSRSLTGVFGLMFLGLLASAGSALFVLSSETMLNLVFGSQFGFWGFVILPFLIVMFAMPRVWKMGLGGGVLLFLVYALLNGITLSVIFLAYDLGTITLAFLSAAGMFGVMALYGAVTKADLSRARSLLMMGLFGIIIATVINIFMRSEGLDILISYVGIAVFLGLTAFDVQRIKTQMNEHPEIPTAGLMVSGALHMYLNFLNIFLFLLRILGRRR